VGVEQLLFIIFVFVILKGSINPKIIAGFLQQSFLLLPAQG